MGRVASVVGGMRGRSPILLYIHSPTPYPHKPHPRQRIESEAAKVTGKLYTSPFEVVREVKAAFSWEAKRRVLNYGDPNAFMGLPSGLPHTLRVLHLGETMMVTARCSDAKGTTPRDAYEARFAVWTRAK